MTVLEIKPSNVLRTKWGTARLHKSGYYRITSGKEGNHGKFLHRLIFEDFYRKIPDDCNIHHKDENPLNNCVNNLQLLTKSQHHSLHKSGEKHHMFNKKHSPESCEKMSKSKNNTGYLNVYKHKNLRYTQGFTWVYSYYNNGKRHEINSVDIKELEKKVRAKGLKWSKLE